MGTIGSLSKKSTATSAALIVVLLTLCNCFQIAYSMPPVGDYNHNSNSYNADNIKDKIHADSSSLPPFMSPEYSPSTSPVQHVAARMSAHSTFMGQFKPVLERLFMNQEQFKHLCKALSQVTHWEDLAIILWTGWFFVPAIKVPYERLHASSWYNDNKPFKQSFTYLVAESLQQVARIALAVYLVDLVKMICVFLELDFCSMHNIPHAFAQSAYTIWLASRLATFKQHVFRRYVINKHPEMYGRIQVVNRLVDAIIYAGALLIVLNILQLETGIAMQSFLAFGSVGTLALGLASQGITTQILNGLLLASSDRLYEGDSVQLGNGAAGGLSGTIVKLGWLETIIRGSDEIVVSLPNTELVKQRISNLSRVRYSQVKQILRFKYSEAEKLPALVDTIKSEIITNCPQVITDGSRPFRVHWSDYGNDYLQVIVDTHYTVRPVGDEYWDNRMRVMQAIHRAVQRHEVAFAEVP